MVLTYSLPFQTLPTNTATIVGETTDDEKSQLHIQLSIVLQMNYIAWPCPLRLVPLPSGGATSAQHSGA